MYTRNSRAYCQLCSGQKTCKNCIDIILNDDYMFCNFFGQRERHFITATDFCEWAFLKEHKGYTSIAHNMKAYMYDGYLLLDHVLRQVFKSRGYI